MSAYANIIAYDTCVGCHLLKQKIGFFVLPHMYSRCQPIRLVVEMFSGNREI